MKIQLSDSDKLLLLSAESEVDKAMLRDLEERLKEEAIFPEHLLHTLTVLRGMGECTAVELNKQLHMPNVTAVNNRLLRLLKMKLVTRRSVTVAEGGRAYHYSVAKVEKTQGEVAVPDMPGVNSDALLLVMNGDSPVALLRGRFIAKRRHYEYPNKSDVEWYEIRLASGKTRTIDITFQIHVVTGTEQII